MSNNSKKVTRTSTQFGTRSEHACTGTWKVVGGGHSLCLEAVRGDGQRVARGADAGGMRGSGACRGCDLRAAARQAGDRRCAAGRGGGAARALPRGRRALRGERRRGMRACRGRRRGARGPGRHGLRAGAGAARPRRHRGRLYPDGGAGAGSRGGRVPTTWASAA